MKTAKRFFEDPTFLLADMVEKTGKTHKECLDMLFDYKEQVLKDPPVQRNYGKYT